MNDITEVMIIVEGKTEQIFVETLLAPHFGAIGINLYPAQLGKPGHKGGNVRFSRMERDVGHFLKQRTNTYVTTMVDYYGIDSQWPGLSEAKSMQNHVKKADTVNKATEKSINKLYSDFQSSSRFISYVSMHEFEALLFSDPQTLSDKLNIPVSKIHYILEQCVEPENINDSPNTAPSRRLLGWNPGFRKTTDCIAIAVLIGLDVMRQHCPIFNGWLNSIEALSPYQYDVNSD